MTRSTLSYCLTLGAALLWLNGCAMLGPDFETPYSESPTNWMEEGNGLFLKPTEDDTIGWWSTFNDPTLDKLIELFSTQNLTLQTAAVRILEARAQLALVKGTIYPQRQEMNGDLFTIGDEETQVTIDRYYNVASIGFDVGWEMDFWGKYRRSIESADANLLSTIADYEDILVSLTAETARAYVDIRTLQERIKLAENNADRQQESLDLVNLQFEAGVVTELDVLQAKTLLSTTRAAIPNFEAALASAKYGLAVLVGVLPEEINALLEPSQPIPEVTNQVATLLPAELLRRRPDIRRAEMQAAAQSAQIGVARTELYPSFSLLGSIGWSANDTGANSLGDIFESNSFSYTFGPAFKWNLFNYGRLKNEVRVQDARYQQTILNYQNIVLNAAREVEDSMKSLVKSFEEAKYIEASVESSERSTELSTLQYEEGLVDYQRVLDSIRSLTVRQDEFAQTKGEIATNAIGLFKAFGGGWQIDYQNDLLLPEEMVDAMAERTDWGKFLTIEQDGDE
ncbi:MAG: efflux transporter outer membrane subunit [Desulfofustis sp.]|nr:efflux transporter outer membrane subunit [Desulfofustis sp.]